MRKIGHYYEEGISKFRVFAPEKEMVEIVFQHDDPLPLIKDALGFWQGSCKKLAEGTLYKVSIDGSAYPDIASKYQPQGVHGYSMVVDPTKVDSSGWKGIPMEQAIIYELHIGTFTPEGTLGAAVTKLDHLQELGITVIELMPINGFPGKRNWGYDGVFHFALQESYGTYKELRDFIEESHRRGMAVILDVVYNHFGPEGNYAPNYAEYTKEAPTPWGAAINFDGAYNYGIREFYLENIRYWLEDIGFDGFRMDAVSLIFDNMPKHILREFTDLIREIEKKEGRRIIHIAEHLRNDKNVTAESGFNYDSQWNDDLNHTISDKLRGNIKGPNHNFGELDDVVKALTHGFVMDGTRLCVGCKYFFGTDGSKTQGVEHVVHTQNHDQVGNRILGDRLITSLGTKRALLGITTVLASPYVPMLFQGEEYGEEAPFFFFEDFSEDWLIKAVEDGRNREFAFDGHKQEPPHSVETFNKSKLQWNRLKIAHGKEILAYYKKLIHLKKQAIIGPLDRSLITVHTDYKREVIAISSDKSTTLLNFSDSPCTLDSLDFSVALGKLGDLSLTSEETYTAGAIEAYGAQVYLR